jgi:RNA polymerase sigma factor (sigma-70 family)
MADAVAPDFSRATRFGATGSNRVWTKDSASVHPLSGVDDRSAAIEQLYRERYVGFRNALATITGNYDTARDAVQEGFARALANRTQLQADVSLAAWVWRIAVRAALEARGRQTSEEPLADTIDPHPVEPDRHPPLTAALATLSPRRRLIVFLRYYADFSYADLAAACDVSEGTVAATLAQAREALADALRLEGVLR